MNYIDLLMKNYSIDSDSPDFNLKGGNIEKRPHGGFPPIIVCSEKEKKDLIEKEEKKEREYSPVKASVSIKKIMEKRRNVKPFISIS